MSGPGARPDGDGSGDLEREVTIRREIRIDRERRYDQDRPGSPDSAREEEAEKEFERQAAEENSRFEENLRMRLRSAGLSDDKVNQLIGAHQRKESHKGQIRRLGVVNPPPAPMPRDRSSERVRENGYLPQQDLFLERERERERDRARIDYDGYSRHDSFERERTRPSSERYGLDTVNEAHYNDRELVEEANYYNNKNMERAFVGEGYDGATANWTLVDVPPGTSRVRMEGKGGAAQEISWQSFNGVRRSMFYPPGSLGAPLQMNLGSTGKATAKQPEDGIVKENELAPITDLVTFHPPEGGGDARETSHQQFTLGDRAWEEPLAALLKKEVERAEKRAEREENSSEAGTEVDVDLDLDEIRAEMRKLRRERRKLRLERYDRRDRARRVSRRSSSGSDEVVSGSDEESSGYISSIPSSYASSKSSSSRSLGPRDRRKRREKEKSKREKEKEKEKKREKKERKERKEREEREKRRLARRERRERIERR